MSQKVTIITGGDGALLSCLSITTSLPPMNCHQFTSFRSLRGGYRRFSSKAPRATHRLQYNHNPGIFQRQHIDARSFCSKSCQVHRFGKRHQRGQQDSERLGQSQIYRRFQEVAESRKIIDAGSSSGTHGTRSSSECSSFEPMSSLTHEMPNPRDSPHHLAWSGPRSSRQNAESSAALALLPDLYQCPPMC